MSDGRPTMGGVTQTVTAPSAEATPLQPPPARRLRPAAVGEEFWGWAATLLVTLIGGFLRFWRLDQPHRLVFDEVYYVKEGVSYLRSGYEMSLRPIPTGSPDPFTLGSRDVFALNPDFVVHPPLGKWMIAAGEWIFGPASSWGWRFSAAVVGTLSILLIGRIARRLFDSPLLGVTAALLLAIDGQEFVHSRTGLLDIFVMFWALAGFGCLLIDRDRSRLRLAARLGEPGTGREFGPWLGMRWWRLAGIVCLGLDTGVKWSGIYFAAAFLVMSVLWDMSARRAAGIERWIVGAAALDGAQALAAAVLVIPATYLATWAGWFAGSGGWDRQWAAENIAAPGWGWVPDAARSLWHYHAEMWHFHLTLHSPHPYQSNPWSWLVLGRPTAFYYDKIAVGQAGCRVVECSQAITPLGNPAIWWGGTLAIGVLLFRWALARDWRAGAVLAGIAGGYLPWFLYQERTIYAFYAVAFVPWMVLAVTYCLGLVLGPRGAPEPRRRTGALLAGSFVFGAFMLFWFFYPLLAGQVITRGDWRLRMWLPGWV